MLQIQLPNVEASHGLRQAVVIQALSFSDVGLEESVPNNEDTSIVAVSRRPMMHSMVEGSVDEIFQPSQAATKFAVNPKLIQSIQLQMYQDGFRWENQGQGQ